jgi:enoyl-CoA hydratase
MNETVLTERRGRVLLITLNRPDVMNAINGALSHELVDAIAALDEDPGLSAGVLTGNGRGFCAGMDLKAYADGEDIGPMMTFIKNGSRKPLIGALEGFALAGGLELALSCDLLVAARGVTLGIPEVKVGLFAAGGGLQRLPSRVGYGRAMEMAITGEPITAEEAAEAGMISRLTEPGEAVNTAIGLAERISENAPLATAASKRLIKAAVDLPERHFYSLQNELMGEVFSSNDSMEGPRAFAEKRPPEWTGT